MADRGAPAPEDQAGHDAAEEILRDSEQRISDAAQAQAPGDAADEHRRSEETVGP